MLRKTFTAPGVPSSGPYSHAVDSGELIYLSGQGPLTENGKVPEGVAAQTEQCFKNLSKVLSAAGLTADNVVKVNVYLTNIDEFAAMNEVYRRYFTAPYPARTTVGVAALPGGIQVEIEMIARKVWTPEASSAREG